MSDFYLQFINNEAEEDEGLGHAGIETFKDTPYASIARECGQNSSDARLGVPVELNFDMLVLQASEVPALDQFRTTVDCCIRKSKDTRDEKNIDFFANAERLVTSDQIKVLRISDQNTTGLRGPSEPGTPFHSLVKATGVSNKEQDTSGGSFGIGKNAVYAASDLQTVFYSTIYRCPESGSEKYLTQGKSILISHSDKDGVPKKATGYWGGTGYRPISDLNRSPDWLKRTSLGTSIFAMGFREMDRWQYRIAASLIRNFFVAIHRGEMQFGVNDGELRVDSSTLAALFKDENVRRAAETSGHLEDFEFSGYLYECLISEEATETTLSIPNLGEFKIRLLVRDDLPKRLVIIRNGMVITDSLENFGDKFKSFPMYRDFVALIEPLDDGGSAQIKKLENPRHDGLSAERLSDEDKRKAAKRKIRALAKAIRLHIKENTQIQLEEVTAIDELSEFFADVDKNQSIPEADADTDPENFTYKPKTRKRKRIKAPVPDKGKEGGAGGNGGTGGGSGSGDGAGDGAGAGGRGNRGVRTAVQLDDERNLIGDASDLARRTIFFTPGSTGKATVIINAPGIASSEVLTLVGSSKGEVSRGYLSLDIADGNREQIEVVFSEPYTGPIDVIALMMADTGDSDAA